MSGYKVTRRFSFAAGHRLLGHEGGCSHMHGHNYRLEVTLQALQLDGVGRVIDFAEIKRRIETWLNENWDHGFILNRDDRTAVNALREMGEDRVFELDGNPTAEFMAEFLFSKVMPELFGGGPLRCIRVVLWETDNCAAEWSVPG